MSGEKGFDFNFDFSSKDAKEESLERIEEQCDRETKEALWGAYKYEKVNCPEPQENHKESDDSQDDDVDIDDLF